jgi:hypothetical protein
MAGSKNTRSKTAVTDHNPTSQSLHNIEINIEPILSLVVGENSAPEATIQP